MLPDSIIRVLSSGSGIILDGSKVLNKTLEQFASTANKSDAVLIIRNADKIILDATMRIADAGKGSVIFDLTSE